MTGPNLMQMKHNQRPNRAIQRTAGRSALSFSMPSTFDLKPQALSPAIADLVSR